MDLRTTAARCLTGLTVLLLTGCASAPTGTTEAGTSGSAWVPAAANSPVIEIRAVEAGVAGVTAQRRAVLYSDGTLLRSDDTSGWVSATLPPTQVQALLTGAADDGLLADQVDLGGGRITDSPWTTVTFTTDAGIRELQLDAPDTADGLSDQQHTQRAAVDRTVRTLFETDGAPWSPDRALAWVEDGNLLDLEVPAPAWTGPTALTYGMTCVDLTEADLAALSGLFDDVTPPTGLDRSVVVQENDGNTYRLRTRDLLPHDPGCP